MGQNFKCQSKGSVYLCPCNISVFLLIKLAKKYFFSENPWVRLPVSPCALMCTMKDWWLSLLGHKILTPYLGRLDCLKSKESLFDGLPFVRKFPNITLTLLTQLGDACCSIVLLWQQWCTKLLWTSFILTLLWTVAAFY